jgi:ubiquinone/menaquinone biosynthesis C-methylase UbiE
MDAAHNIAIRDQFALQAPTFADAGFAVRGLEWIVDQLSPAGDEQVLDVAAGAAHLGRALAPHVSHVGALDLTPEMLWQGQRLANEAGLRNIDFLVANASNLPWIDRQFDLVTCRLAVHQVAHPGAMISEMVRVTRPGGRLAVIDIVAGADPEAAAEAERLEKLRDPSHGRTHSIREICSLLESAGASVTSTETRDQPLGLEDWMERTAAPNHVRDQIRGRFTAELEGGAPTGLHPFRAHDGNLGFVHTWALILATPLSEYKRHG